MSNRTLVELNHDFCPNLADDKQLLELGMKIALFMASGDKKNLPRGVTFKHMRHHSDEDPMEGYGDPS